MKRMCGTIVVVEKSKDITYSECKFGKLSIQNAMCMRHIVICFLPGYTTFFHTVA